MVRTEKTTGFAREEYVSRAAKVRESMLRKGLAALVVYDDDRMVNGGSARYLSNFVNTDPFSPTVVVLVPDQEPALCISPGFRGCMFTSARSRSWIRNIKGTRTTGWGVDWAKDIAEALSDANFKGGRVGIDGLHLMSFGLVEQLKASLPDGAVEDATGLVEQVRIPKSRAEVKLLRRAATLSEKGFAAFVKAARPGALQANAIAQAELPVKKAGAEAMMFMGTGLPWVWGCRRGDLRFDSGDMVAAEFNARYHGYLGQICRTFFLGEGTPEQHAVRDAAVAAYERMVSAIKPGVTAGELFDIGIDVVRRAGFEYSGVRFGHGLGLSLAEGFNIEPGDATPVDIGTCLVVHPCIALPDRGHSAIYGDTILVGRDGIEVLTRSRESRRS